MAGASEGLGAAFAEALAGRGHHLVLLARRGDVLETVAHALEKRYEVETRTLVADLSAPSAIERLAALTRDLDVGVAVYNAAYGPIGPFMDLKPEQLDTLATVNVHSPLRFAHAMAEQMKSRKRGALVLMSSLAGLQGTPGVTAYAATKAFNVVLGEGLWAELRAHGIEVLVTCAGAIRTPNYQQASEREAPGTLDPEQVAERTLDALGRGPRFVPGWINRLAALFVGRLLPRRLAIAIMRSSTQKYS